MAGPKEKEPTQKTSEGHEVPIPKKGEFFDNLKKASKPEKSETEAESDREEEGDDDDA